jgi:CMP-N-acetylneuraminic acid synthetase
MTRIDPTSGAVRPWEGDVLNHGVFRRQDLPPAYIPDGGIIVVTREALMLEIPGVPPGPHAFFGREDRRQGVINAEGAVIDIDTKFDMMVAEAMLSTRPD